MLIFGITSFIGGVVCFLLPETKGHPLTQTIEDGEEFMKQNMYKSAPWYEQSLIMSTREFTYNIKTNQKC